uniref:Uncharacterized protein n=1 Tax=Solanum tuberosum TaxID=4113 RepID=M1BH21_SOLTU
MGLQKERSFVEYAIMTGLEEEAPANSVPAAAIRILSPPNQWNIVHRDRRSVPTRLQNGASVQSCRGSCRMVKPGAVRILTGFELSKLHAVGELRRGKGSHSKETLHLLNWNDSYPYLSLYSEKSLSARPRGINRSLPVLKPKDGAENL